MSLITTHPKDAKRATRTMQLFAWLVTYALLSCSVKADLLDATLAYHQGDYNKAQQQFYELAQLGNVDAIYNIGVMYLHGQGREKNPAKAYAWFNLAADFGLEEARDTARLIAKQSEQQHQALEDAYAALLTNISYEKYDQELRPELTAEPVHKQSVYRSYTVEPTYPEHAYNNGLEGWVWLEFDIDKNGAVGDITLVDSYPKNTFDKPLINAVKRWQYEAPSEIEHAYYNRSLLYHFTTFKGEQYQQSFQRQQKSYQSEISELIDAAEQGNALVQYYIANWLSSDKYNASKLLKYHWQKDTASSELLLTSARNGYANSQYRIGANLLRGDYGRVDRQKGLNWVLLAAQNGFANAQYRLGRELLNKQYVDYAPNKARKWLIAAAAQGHFRAKRDLAALLFELNEPVADIQQALDDALKLDKSHPQLLLLQAKLQQQQKQIEQAKFSAQAALNEARDRNWSTQAISAFLTLLN